MYKFTKIQDPLRCDAIVAIDCKTVVFGRFWKAPSAVSVVLECEAREPHMPSPFSLAVFTLAPLRPFVRIWSVARVRKKYDCFVVYCCDRNNILMEYFLSACIKGSKS